MVIGEDICYATDLLKKGEVVAIPTETVYGLAANAFDKKAVAKIFEIKNRPTFNPLIVHVKTIDYIYQIAQNIDNRLIELMKIFSPGPLSILVEKKSNIPDIVTAGSRKVAIRIPSHPLTLKLLNIIDFPLAAPSANPFQYISPTLPQQVAQQLGEKIPYILDGGKCTVGIESTIIGIENNMITVYRLGGIPIEQIEKYTGQVVLKIHAKTTNTIETPGQLTKHYSPKKKIFIGNIEEMLQKFSDKKISLITFGRKTFPKAENITEYNLSKEENLIEAATNLFEALYNIDCSGSEIILAELLPNEGLGRAINDRLLRASVS